MIPGSANPLLLATADAGGYTISRSLRFNSADSAYLSRTPASAGNRKTWSYSTWLKICSVSGLYNFWLFAASASGSNDDNISVTNSAIGYQNYNGSITAAVSTAAVFRDPSAWYHIVVAIDTTQATASNRVKFYVNGSQITALSGTTYPSQNFESSFNSSNVHNIGRNIPNNNVQSNGYLADIHFIDGQALDPTSFGEFSATTGVWMPKAFTGSYGTNGFKLDFADNSAATAAALGKDTSGNGNNFTPTNLSVTAGAGNDSLVDVPVNGSEVDTGAGGEVRGNYCTWNPLANTGSSVLSDGNLTASVSGGPGTTGTFRGSIGMSSGKWYWEQRYDARFTNANTTGIANSSTANTISISGDAVGTIYGFAFNADNGTLFIAKDNVWINSGNPVTGANPVASLLTAGPYFPYTGLSLTHAYGTYTSTLTANFGQRPFAYTAPSGFKALNTANLPAPLVTKPSDLFDVKLYTGNGSTQTISGLGFSPDLVWIKNRQDNLSWNLFNDTVRGANKILAANETGAEYTNDINGYLSAFTSDGFTVVNGGNGIQVNGSGKPFVYWAWDAGSSTVTNTQGSISSQVRANASAGFSIVTWSAPASGSGWTVGHGLGAAPFLLIDKCRSNTGNWTVYHASLGATKALYLNGTDAQQTSSIYWNNTAPTSQVFTCGTTGWYGASFTHVTYCFAPVVGYSSFGSYTGNGSADGPFVYLGFRPAFVIVKMSSSTGNWTMLDAKREGYNVDNDPLFPNLSNAEGTTDLIDITSNGFKVRTTDATFNTNAGTYVFAAWAESPFQYSRAR